MANRFVVCAGYADYVRNKPRNVGDKPRRYSKTKMDMTSHMDVTSQPVCLGGVVVGMGITTRPGTLPEPRRHTIKLQHEDQLRLEL